MTMTGRLTRRERWFVGLGVLATAALGAALAVMFAPAPSHVAGAPIARTVGFEAVDAPVAAYVERLRAAGEPTTTREAVERDAPSAGNAAEQVGMAALLLHEEFDLNSDLSGEPRFWPWGGADRPEDETPENLARLSELAPHLETTADFVARALDAPRCRFSFEECDTPENLATLIPDADRVVKALQSVADGSADPSTLTKALNAGPAFSQYANNSMRLMIGRALAGVAVASSKSDRRVAACRSLLLLGRGDEPSRILDLMGEQRFLVRAVEALRFGIERGTLDAAACRAALDGPLAGTAFARLPAALQGERARAIDEYRSFVIAQVDTSRRALLAPSIVMQCEAMREIEAVPSSRAAENLTKVRQVAERGGPLVIGLSSVVRKLWQCDAATRLARVALAVAEHRATHGDFPASLDELKPMFADGVPLDPFTDAQFAYERTAAGVRIASMGRLADEPALDDATLRERCLVWELKR